MSKERTYSAPNLNGVKDPAEFKRYLDRMVLMKRRVFYEGRWWGDPRELKEYLKL